MANQIARFFEPYPDTEAVDGVLDHLKRFWSPAMRSQLISSVHRAKTPLDPLVVRAVARLTA